MEMKLPVFNPEHNKKDEELVKEVFSTGFNLIEDNIKELTRESREQIKNEKIMFGISFLDDSFGGMSRNDLVVIGAQSGDGKSEMAVSIALNACTSNKKVYYFALEYEKKEIENRILFRLISKRFFQDFNRNRECDFCYATFHDGELEDVVEKYLSDSLKELETITNGNLEVYYRDEKGFTIKDFMDKIKFIRKDADLIIVDHLHYIDIDAKDEINENRAVGKIVKQLRQVTLDEQIPIVLVSHVRKKEKFSKALISSIEELHGSSDIYKIATKVIMINPNYEESTHTLFSTFIHTAKGRLRGSVKRYVGVINFDIEKNEYQENYNVRKIIGGLDKFEDIPISELPRWARRAYGRITEDIKSSKDDVLRF